jgi:DNA-binding transcriptional regulator YbjK
MASSPTRRPRRYDPERRERIAAAAIRVVARDGIEGLTHRTVAKEADVPLGSTTYHFADKDDLLRAAIELAEANNRDVMGQMLDTFEPQTDLALAVARLVETLTIDLRDQLLVEYELFLAARSRPALRDGASRWIADIRAMMRRYTDDDVTAWAVAQMFEGILIHALALGTGVRTEDALPTLRRLLDA